MIVAACSCFFLIEKEKPLHYLLFLVSAFIFINWVVLSWEDFLNIPSFPYILLGVLIILYFVYVQNKKLTINRYHLVGAFF